MRELITPLIALLVSAGALCLACAGCSRAERRPDLSSERPDSRVSDGADMGTDHDADMGDGEMGDDASSCVQDVRAVAALDLEVPGFDPESIEIIEGGPDLDGDEVGDTIAQAFVDDARVIGLYATNSGCMMFRGALRASSIEVRDTASLGMKDLDAWQPAACANGVGGVLLQYRFDGVRYAIDRQVDCPCDPNNLRDDSCPEP